MAIQTMLGANQTKLYTGKEAVKKVLNQGATPRILHLATHGFFLKEQAPTQLGVSLNASGMGLLSDALAKPDGKTLENPMLRSGIALAGANASIKSGEIQYDDGILTAEEVRGLRLWGTEMVVLSACDTGLGEVKTGEGVFGLRRAFAQAGAKSLVMSLWAVPDQETKELMVQFYRNIQSGGMDRCQALRQALLKEMKIVQERHDKPYPLCWGGFVFLGDPGQPLPN